MKPINLGHQKLLKHKLTIRPDPSFQVEHKDFYENTFVHFTIERPHEKLVVEAQSEVLINIPDWASFHLDKSIPWENVVSRLKSTNTLNDIRQYYLESELVYFIPEIKEYSMQFFTPGRPLLDAVNELNSSIFEEFEYKPGYTDISTPLDQIWQEKKGVCQDFAHFFISCLRSLGLAACYVSGYIETVAPPGKKKLKGADASHAWVAVYEPLIGWVEFDPTNNLMVSDQHIKVGIGRDFKDVVPMKGVVYSSGAHELKVMVDVHRISN